jgi:hypothetical protein
VYTLGTVRACMYLCVRCVAKYSRLCVMYAAQGRAQAVADLVILLSKAAPASDGVRTRPCRSLAVGLH